MLTFSDRFNVSAYYSETNTRHFKDIMCWFGWCQFTVWLVLLSTLEFNAFTLNSGQLMKTKQRDSSHRSTNPGISFNEQE